MASSNKKYVVQFLVEAKSVEEAIKMAKRGDPEEVYLEKVEDKRPTGFN